MKQLNLIDLKTKKCSKCGEVKPVSEFYADNRLKNKLRSYCKKCSKEYDEKWRENNSEYHKEYYQANKEKKKKYAKKYYQDNSKKYKENGRKWRKNNPKYDRERKRKWAKDNREKVRAIDKRNRKKHPEKLKEKQKKQYIKRVSIPKYKLSNNISTLIWHSLKGNKKGNHWENLIGYTLQDLMAHLESLFKPGMNWENIGRNGWHIDHIKPISSFNFNSYNDPEFKECWALKNLQPLWESENLSKGAKF